MPRSTGGKPSPEHPTGSTGREERVVNLLGLIVDRIDELTPGIEQELIPGRPVIAAVPSKPGEVASLKACKPEVLPLKGAAKVCFQISVHTTEKGKNATVDIAWTDNMGVVVNDQGLKAGENTPCRCNMKRVQVHAMNGSASYSLELCDP